MKILRFADNTPYIRKLIGERKIFITLVRSLWLHEVFFIFFVIIKELKKIVLLPIPVYRADQVRKPIHLHRKNLFAGHPHTRFSIRSQHFGTTDNLALDTI